MHNSAALFLRSIVKRIHPQLPLTPRESQQLLEQLTSSFRRQLDYKSVTFRPEALAKSNLNRHGNSQAVVEREKGPISYEHANHHLKSILTNPLIHGNANAEISSKNGKWPSHPTSNISEAKQMLRDPVTWFETRISRGTASPLTARMFLETLHRSILSSPALSVEEAMHKTRAGSKVLNWARCTGIATSREFVSDHRLLGLVTQFLVAEGRYESIINWFSLDETLCGPETVNKPSFRPSWKDEVVRIVIRTCLAREDGFNRAVKTFMHLVTAHRVMRKQPHEYLPPELAHGARHLCLKLIMEPNPVFSVDLFEAFFGIIQDFSKHVELDRACLQCRHPAAPEYDAGLAYLHYLCRWGFPKGIKRTSKLRKTLQLCLDTARLLIKDNKHADAVWVLEFAREHFSDDLGLKNDDSLSEDHDESLTRLSSSVLC